MARKKLFPTNRTWVPVTLLVALASLLGACAPSQQEIMARNRLEQAQKAYAESKADPQVEALAPLALADASKVLQQAEQAKDFGEMDHLAYLAERKAKIAATVAEQRAAEKQTEALTKETDDMLSQKRDREAKQARLDVERKTRELEKARLAAEEQAKDIEKARAAAEAQRRALDEAKAAAEAQARALDESRAATQAQATAAEKAKAEAEAKAREAEKARTEAQQLATALSDLKAEQTDRGFVITMGDVLFDTGKAALSSAANRNIDTLADFLRRYPTRNLLIEGHTDSVGSDQLNMTLSAQRAEAAKMALVAKGVGSERIFTKGYGKMYPIATNDTAEGRRQNRRVEVIVLNEGAKPDSMFR